MHILMKYILILLFPFLLFANTQNKATNMVTPREAAVQFIFMMSDTVDALQKERGASVGYIGSNANHFRKKLTTLKANSDRSKQKLLQYLQQENRVLQKYFYKNESESLKKLFSNLSQLRRQVQSLQINYPKTYSKYTQIIGVLLLSISNISDRLENKALINELYDYSILLLYKESMGQKRAALSGLFSQKKFSKEIYEYFITADTQEKIYLKTFLHSVDSSTKELYISLFKNSRDVQKVAEYERLALQKLQGKDVVVNPEEWFDSITKKINLLKKLEDRLTDEILTLTKKVDSGSSIAFTVQEQEWLATKPVISYTYDPNWKPFEYKNGISEHVGIIADILKIIEKKSGIRFVASPVNSWNDALDKLKNRSVDMISALAKNRERLEYADFTKNVIFTVPNVFVTREKDEYKNGFSNIKGKKIAVIREYAVESIIKYDKPRLSLVRVNDVVDGLDKLEDEKIDVFVINLATAEYYLKQEKYKNLKIAYRTHYDFNLRIAFAKGYPEVARETIDKVIKSITVDERKAIYDKWSKKSHTSMASVKNSGLRTSITDILPFKEIFIVTLILFIVTFLILRYLKMRGEINIGIPVFIFGTIFSIMTILVVVISISNLEKVKKEELKNSLVTITNSSYIALDEWYLNNKESIEYIVKHSPYLKNIVNLVRHKEDIIFLQQNQSDIKKYYNDVTHSFKDRVSYFIATKDNTILSSSTNELIGTKIELPFVTKEIQNAFENGYAFIHPKIDKSDKYQLFRNLYFVTPLYDAETGKIVAVYATGVDPQSMIRIMLEERLGKTGETYIINRKAQLISNSRFDKELQERGILKQNEKSFLNVRVFFNGKPTLAAKSVLKEEAGYSLKAYKDYRGKYVYGSWLWNKELHFGIITEIDKTEAINSFDTLKQTIYFTVFSIVGFVIMLMILIVWFSNRNSKVLQAKNRELEVFSTSLEHKVQERTAELNSSINRFSTLFESSPDSIAIINQEGIYVDCNQATLNLFGVKNKKDFIGTKPELYSPLKQPSGELSNDLAEERISKVFTNGTQYFEWLHCRIDTGEVFDAEVILSSVILDAKPHMYAVVRDITQRKHLESAIRQNNDHMALVAQHAHLGFWYFNPQVGDLFVNNVFVTMLGYDADEVLQEGYEKEMFKPFKDGLTFWEQLLHPDDVEKTTKIITAHLNGESELYKVDYRMRRADGSWMWSTAIGKISEWDSEGKAIRFNGVNLDIDESKEIEEKLIKQQQKIDDERNFVSSIISSSQDALIVVNEEAHITVWNESATKIFGYTKEEMIGQNVLKIIPKKFRELHEKGFYRVVNGGKGKLLGQGAIEIEGQHKDGKFISIDLALNYFTIDKKMFFSANIRDITERKELVEKIKVERQFSQTLLDSQSSIIISTDGTMIKSVNKSFFEFFHINSLEEFTKDYACICEKFVAVEGESYLLPRMGESTWVEYIVSHPSQRHIAFIDDFLFVVNVEKSIFNNEELYVAVFTDVTELEKSQKDLKYALQTIESTNKKIHDSIEYASFIQGALIPNNELLNTSYSDSFVVWQPKDIVGGDIYLFEKLRTENESLLMVIDCTGHGVPGAFVTMLVKAIERQVVAKIQNDENIDVSPAWILSYFNRKMKQLLKQEEKDSLSNAGFDGGIVYYNKKDKVLKYAGAETPLFYVEDDVLKTIKGSHHSIGYKTSDTSFEFKEHIFEVKEGMQFYLTTDGYLDQNGGEKGFPFGKKHFKEIISTYYQETMADQKEIFLSQLDMYQDEEERNDDVTLIGFKI